MGGLYPILLLLLSRFSRVRLCATPETAAHQAPLSLGFSRQEHWSGCHFLLQCMKVKVKSLSRVRLLATPWTAAYQAPPSMGFSRREDWSGVPLPSPIQYWCLYKKQSRRTHTQDKDHRKTQGEHGVCKSRREASETNPADSLISVFQIADTEPVNLCSLGRPPWGAWLQEPKQTNPAGLSSVVKRCFSLLKLSSEDNLKG